MNDKNDIIRFSVSLPQSLLVELDAKVDGKSYASRSEYIRDLIRQKMIQDNWEDDSIELVGVLTIIYTHHHSDLVLRMLDLQHDAEIDIVCTTHVHLDHHNCLETLVLKGEARKIIAFSDSMAGLKGVKHCELTKTAITHS
ncbi:Putative nickel-responsive regulator [Campylobacter majalis]|uniref:Putative nickel-responsive regulator n=1 Tax=Campylobacter majalis TaxID=2790656 RepID=A0ABN7K4D7_9BACT|nr:nickel-responsive transcriptional regulator NikR [Campylobacter majalis]CAD7287406.1 Putative nickel-responsive regulator [Campylobacter majalis]